MASRKIKPQSPELLRLFGARLRAERIRVGLTQEEFAGIGGVTRRSQIHYESGARAPTVEYLIRVAEIGVSPTHIFPASSTPAASNLNVLTREEHDRFSIPKVLLPKVMATADQIMETMGVSAVDSDFRSTLTVKVLEAVAQQTTDEIDWVAISVAIENQIGGE